MKRRAAVRTGAGSLTEDQLEFLTTGEVFLDPGSEAGGYWDTAGGRRAWIPFPSMEAAQKAWKDHKAEVRAAAAATGERPWAESEWP